MYNLNLKHEQKLRENEDWVTPNFCKIKPKQTKRSSPYLESEIWERVKTGIVAANNHYAGFGAATANMFRVMSGLAPVQWGMQKDFDYLIDNQENSVIKVVTEKANKRHCLIILVHDS